MPNLEIEGEIKKETDRQADRSYNRKQTGKNKRERERGTHRLMNYKTDRDKSRPSISDISTYPINYTTALPQMI